ncbi:MAG: extracellular solute-binding protein [Spirochaetaceae bacterium]|jgi:raffinose/stachyose/melibiose transport system substrate-binding protein|nr:extracellular solute-binding protein [Spirochaetaceae bacterium]
MKKLMCVILGLCLAAGVFAGGARAGSSARGGTELYMFISQPEYADAINTLIAEYKKVAPNVTVNYETTQDDYPTLLKAKLNSGDVPDIFTSTAGKEIDLYREYSMDLSGQPLTGTMLPAVNDSMKAMSDGAGPYGFAIKGNFFGILYNKEIFERAGIAEFPQTLDALEAACAKISALGIKPFTSGFAEWWVFKHTAMNFFGTASGNAVDLVKQFESGRAKIADYPVLYNNLFRYIDLVVKYGDNKPLETSLNSEIAAFARGEAAMVNGQGAWIEADVLKVNPNIRIGFDGYPVSNNLADCKVVTGADQAMRVSSQSKHQKELLDFVNWWYTSDYGKNWFVNVAQVVPPVVVSTLPNMEVVKQGTALAEKEGSAPLSIIYSTDAFHMAFGEALQAYVGGTLSKDAVCALIERRWVELEN